MLRVVILYTLSSIIASPLLAQSSAKLRDRVSDLFRFGNCDGLLCLDGSINAGTGHGDHFLPAFASGNAAIISFITNAIGQSVSNTPISATSSGATFSFVGGLPVRTSTSAGPIFAERAQTLGRGKFFVGANVSGAHFTTLNGVPADNLSLNFVHEDVSNAGTLGDPEFENDVIDVTMGLDIDVLVTSVFMTYGITDFIDIGVALPFVRTSLKGSSEAQIMPFGSTAFHFFGGSIADPVLRAASSIDGSATGIGDVAARIKINLGQSPKVGAALLGDVRFATGDEEDLLGAGDASGRALAVVSAQFGAFAPHLNAGYVVRAANEQNDAALATIGFDNLMTSWATLAFDVLTEWQIGADKNSLPGPITYDQPFRREVQSSPIVERRANIVNASVGMKFTLRGGTVLVTNAIFPLTETGLQPDVVWTAGLEYNF
ncbi:MAG: hypothetical protein ACE5HT_02830 [Gemmatimonadales bacterium]